MKKKIFAMLLAVALPLAVISNSASAVTATLYQGMWSSQVKTLQNDLKTLGYFSYNSTGYFGTHTKQSVVNYQRANKLAADGIAGSQTLREIEADKMIQNANKYIGVPYVWGGTSPSGFDCSGFTKYIFGTEGHYLPRTAALQFNSGYEIPRSQLKTGDLVFFSTYKAGPSHVGIYISDNKFIGASSSQGVSKAELTNSYWGPRFIGARRVIS